MAAPKTTQLRLLLAGAPTPHVARKRPLAAALGMLGFDHTTPAEAILREALRGHAPLPTTWRGRSPRAGADRVNDTRREILAEEAS